MKSIAEYAQAAVRVDKELGEWFGMTAGTRSDINNNIHYIFRKNNGCN